MNPSDLSSKALLDLNEVRIDPAWAMRVPSTLALRRQVIAFSFVDEHVCIAHAKPLDSACMGALQKHLKKPLRLFQAEPDSLRETLKRIYSNQASTQVRSTTEEGETAVALCDELLNAAMMQQASDLHLDPGPNETLIRLRVDGVLHDYRPLPAAAHAGMISRFKVLANMDIAERRAPQDGRFRFETGDNRIIDIRVASLPTRHGERMTLRFLASQTESLTLERLGMEASDLERFNESILRPHGMILITGPTGSGKSTTLYAGLRRLISQGSYNVITIEDPIEYEMERVGQVEVDSSDKVSFSKALRSVLRHDPDIVMIGEIRDHETADVAIKSALTGHLVMSTVHTNSAASAITRLADMQIDRFLIAATIRMAVAQRLVRKLCRHCRKPRPLTEAEAIALGHPDAAGSEVFDAGGCHFCANHGYVGRLGLFEMLVIDQELSRMISSGADEATLTEAATERGMRRLTEDGLQKLLEGKTSVKEVLAGVSSW
ncbi:General secretion pathway protein GspE [Planctomycetales bacterium 10988]|nr:General secretion pathway protein GspE [Planctomycetales bacterium 10988]